jgi:hypothetical protein
MPSTAHAVFPSIRPASVAKVPLAVPGLPIEPEFGRMQARSAMFYHIAKNGTLEALFDRTGYEEVMLRCARIGYKP